MDVETKGTIEKTEAEGVQDEAMEMTTDVDHGLTIDTAADDTLTIDTAQQAGLAVDNPLHQQVDTTNEDGTIKEGNSPVPEAEKELDVEHHLTKVDDTLSQEEKGLDIDQHVVKVDESLVTKEEKTLVDEEHLVKVDEEHFVKVDEEHLVKVDEENLVKVDEEHLVKVDEEHLVKVDEEHLVKVDEEHLVKVDEEHLVKVDEGSRSLSLADTESGGSLGVVEAVSVVQSDRTVLGQQGEPETITISLEEATQIFLQQQGLQGAVQIAPGTYIQVAADGTLASGITAAGDPLQVITTGDGDLVSYSIHPDGAEGGEGMVAEVGGQLIRIDKATIDGANLVQSEGDPVKQDADDVASVLGSQSAEVVAQASSQCQVISTAEGQFTVSGAHYVQGEGGIIVNAGEHLSSEAQVVAISEGKLVTVSQGGHALASESQLPTTVQISSSGPGLTPSSRQLTVNANGQIVTSNSVQYSLLSGAETRVTQCGTHMMTSTSVGKPIKTEPKAFRQPDLNSPISVEDKTEVVINGKKCLLMMNPETKQMCAYPLLPPQGKKKRGRPRKPRPGEEGYEPPTSKPGTPGSDVISDTPTEQMSSAAEGLLELSNAGPDGIRRSNRARKKARVLDDYDVFEESGSEEEAQPDDYEADPEVTITGIKRRKIPVTSATAFAFSVAGAKRGRGRPRRYPPAGQIQPPSPIPAVIIPSANGQTLMMAPIQGIQNIQALQSQAKTLQKIEPKPSSESTEAALAISDSSLITSTPSKLSRDTTVTSIALDSANSSILDNSNILINELPTGGDTDNDEMETEGTEKSGDGEDGDGTGQATIIQIPENMLGMFVQKKDPVKIGIKASEIDLEKLRCPKCDFQACYPQQYQDHIATHGDDIHKCKCCNYLTFNKDDLMDHFKETHPRCICNICHFMAEHAYIIKRHMMRHNAQGCTCDICGKVYKDQYILKMHIKMVHMPAEVLFECTVCSKKFTRKAHLKRHLRIHDPEKPFKCPHCDYRGCERSDISKHLLIHQEPKHVCEVCGKPFRHIKNKELHVKRHNGQRDYKCGVCDFYGYTFTDIRKHIERKHADIKTLVCDRCGSAFKSEALLRDHQKENCEVMMIEQALAIATSSGGTSQATIQFPSTLSVDGKHITIDGQQIAVDQIAVDGGQVNITVEQVMQDDEGLTLTEDQVVDGQMTVSEAQITDSTAGMGEVIQVSHQEEEEEDDEEMENMEEEEEMMSIAE